MTTRPLVLALAIAASLAAGCTQTSPAAKADAGTLRTLGSLAFKPCSLPSPSPRGEPLEAQCTTFAVPEDRSKPGGRSIALNIAWIPPRNTGDPATDPVFFLAGGPGQAAVATFPALAPVFNDVMKDRGIVLVDQRGTGKSNPLNCKNEASEQFGSDPAAARTWIEGCIAELSAKADLRRYTTTDAVADLDAVRKAIGADKINLIGVSYGTRMAQQYTLRHPQHVRTVTLDSPVPNTLGLGNIFAGNLDSALQAQFALCKESPACKGRMGDPRAELQSVLTRLRANPVQVTYRDGSTGEEVTETMTADHVAGLVRMYSYMPAAGALLPQLIHEASQGRYANLMALAKMMQSDMQDAMSMGMQMSVICTEDAASMVTRAEDADTVLGNRMVEAMAAMCQAWPKGDKPADFNTPLKGDLPVLVLTGEFDPVTPPRYGEQIANTGLPNARWLNLKGQGHNVIGAGCMPKLFAQFIEKADAKALDAKCLDKLAYVPPFTSNNGWEP
ncbi:MAG TPA: alpha/beta fold hydrolase [Thermomonas sp.]|jgi:pimeloyl-ACP methyl ester carboxylesterase|uniref:alpha/beta fold hydrolase n=1 Tax=Thermomonas sp. TaxID=1971895 RepID=UPI002B9741D7|nr:alpha/beta fold hydrolase [Thermomonas sp.]HPM56902.1 alpha/beta fold hydrolase [Thermomonas sp.]